MRRFDLAPGEYYHIYNKRIGTEPIFKSQRDYIRFLFLLLFFQSKYSIQNTRRQVDHYEKKGWFNVDETIISQILKDRMVEVVAFAIMPTHFHILLSEVVEGGTSRYMQKIQAGYAKYSQLKYGHSGHLFRGSYGAKRILDNNQLLYLSTYIHRNPRELKGWSGQEHKYYWSSCPDYLSVNRWGVLLKNNIVLEQFKSPKDYRVFLNSSISKEKKYLSDMLFD